MKKIFTLIAAIAVTIGAMAQTKLIDYPAAQTGITLTAAEGKKCEFSSVKIHANKDNISAILIGNGYVAKNTLVCYGTLSVDGGFKKGDVIKIAGCFSNDKDDRGAAVTFWTVDGAPQNNDLIFTTNNFINGKKSADDPSIQTYTLAADADNLYFGRASVDNATTTYITSLVIERGTPTGITTITSQTADNAVKFNLAGQRVNAKAKGIVVANGKKYLVK